jgi:Flp pilus assembly protein TadG
MQVSSHKFRSFISDESGSMALLIIGFFIAALSALMVVTDVAVVANAKRSLDQVTEAASMRAVHTLNEKEYYSGKHNILLSVVNVIEHNQFYENRIPIDCEKGLSEARSEFETWSATKSSMKTLQIQNYNLNEFYCQYDWVRIQTSAEVKLPFPAPFTDFDKATVRSSITTTNQKDKGLWLFGKRIL